MLTLDAWAKQMEPVWSDMANRLRAWSEGGLCQCGGCVANRKMTLKALCSGRGRLEQLPHGHVHPVFMGLDWGVVRIVDSEGTPFQPILEGFSSYPPVS